MTEPDGHAPLTVGNGDFGCTVDITGMQTFTAFHDPTLAGDRLVANTCTQTTWGWHEMPNPHGYTMAEAMSAYPTMRGDVQYPDMLDMWGILGFEIAPEMAAGKWLHVNPQRLDLGRTGLVLRSSLDADAEADPSKLSNIHQRLHLWSGTIISSFEYAGHPVSVTTVAHPNRAQVAFRIESPLLGAGLLEVRLAFPYASDGFMETANWHAGDRHRTTVEERNGGARIVRTLDATTYTVGLSWDTGALHRTDDPNVVGVTAKANALDLVVAYAGGLAELAEDTVDGTLSAAAAWWESFWLSGAAIDLARCTDRRAPELERRIVLSQYLMAVNCSGHVPPQQPPPGYGARYAIRSPVLMPTRALFRRRPHRRRVAGGDRAPTARAGRGSPDRPSCRSC